MNTINLTNICLIESNNLSLSIIKKEYDKKIKRKINKNASCRNLLNSSYDRVSNNRGNIHYCIFNSITK